MSNFLDRMAIVAFKYTYIFSLIALFFLIVYSIGESCSFINFLSISGIVISLAIASAGAGGIIGFLFGIPHTLQQSGVAVTPLQTGTNPQTAQPASNSSTVTPTALASSNAAVGSVPSTTTALISTSTAIPTPAQSTPRNTNYGRSTNLEQIADWLTKIIVGVGLVDLHKIIDNFNLVCISIGNALHGLGPRQNSSQVLSGAIIITFVIVGFLIAYLWTYLYLLEIQNQTLQTEAILTSVNQTIQNNDLNNKHATDLANIQLNLPFNANDIADADLNSAFSNASQNVCSMIFFNAISWRKQNCNSPDTKYRVGKTIPIFKALIAIDANFEYPENYLELGYAYKDNNNPDYVLAFQNIDKSISNFSRANGRIINVPLAYFNRAWCRIKIDKEFNQGISSLPENQTLIMQDLTESSKDECIKDVVSNDDEIKSWKEINDK